MISVPLADLRELKALEEYLVELPKKPELSPQSLLVHCTLILVAIVFTSLIAATYFKRKTHRQVVEFTIAPPIRGPSRRASAKTTEHKLEYAPYLFSGTTSKKVTKVKAYIPDPPMP